jgi:GLPGLI family protein
MSRQYLIFILFLAGCSICYCQNVEVIYHTDFARNAANLKTIGSEQTKLVIGGGSSEFYSPFRARIDSLLEVMEKRGASYEEYSREKGKLPDGYIHFRIYKNCPQKGVLTFTDRFASTNYKYTETQEKPQWKIEKITKEILGYKCQKAIANFRGRTWIAWYAPDIPIQDGPWKLWGLPGIILEAKDSDSLYNFVAIGLEKKEAKPIILRKERYLNCTRDEYMNQKKIYGQNPTVAIAKNRGGEVKITNGKGESVKIKDMGREYIDIEKDIKSE